MPSESTEKRLRVLHLEDNASDHVFLRETLESDGVVADYRVAKTRHEFEKALQDGDYDLIISDFTLPAFDGLTALTIARALCPETPFIFFSGTIGEEVAVDSLRNGAVDYVLKQRPNRLSPAVRRALHNAQERYRLRRTEQALEQSEERYRIVMRASNDVIWDWNLATRKIGMSENFQNVFGYSLDDIGDEPERWQDLIHPDDRERVMSGLSGMLKTGENVWWSEHRIRRSDGSYAHIFDRASMLCDTAGKPSRLVGVWIDVTDRKRAEEKIREQAALLNKASDAIILCDMEPRIIFWNQGAERIYGWSAQEAQGKILPQLLFHGDPPPKIAEALKRMDVRGDWMGELEEFTKDNRTVIVQARATLIRDDQGRPKSLLIINTDITERKKLEEQFLRAQRLESLGVLVSGIAHDLNNALSPVLMGVSMLRAQPASKDAESILNMVDGSARRGADMVKQVLAFARGGDTDKTVLHLDQLLKEMGKIISDVFPKSIKCKVQTGKDSWPVSGVPTQLHQVLMNFCVNARDAMPRGGSLTLTTKNVELNADEASLHEDANPGRYLCTSVVDTGCGMTPEQLKKIFQPFFTTKAPGKGTGLGLSTSLNIVKHHGGFISVRSEVDRGTEFAFYLPADVPKARPEPQVEKPPLPSGSGECVLVVDDEEIVLAITRTTLENYGYRVLTAASGPEAVACLAEKREKVSLIMTDLGMPFMDGEATIMALRKIVPQVRIITTSGLEQESPPDTKRHLKTSAFIQKPFTAETLLRTIHDVLSKPN